ncbi:hypothetical protein CRU92_04575 [Arcobacter sp. FW59]|nr:hypothetical protein CRU92_04575 [Arcobacter sp. FW59]
MKNKITKKMLSELQLVNKRLKKLQDTLLSEAMKIDKELSKRVEDKNDILDDYEIEIKISFILKDSDPKYKENDDNIITKIKEYMTNISDDKYKKTSSYIWSENHNEFFGREHHQMKDEYHCWWYHCLYDHNNLSFKDILRIGRIWSDIKVYYQYFDEDLS